MADRKPPKAHDGAFPRVLVLDNSPIGQTSATGQLKTVFFGAWPEDRLLQVWENIDGDGVASRYTLGYDRDIEASRREAPGDEQLLEVCRAFAPEVIYFRPAESPDFMGFTEAVIDALGLPVVTHLMDDWPERMKHEAPERFESMDSALRRILGRSAGHLGVSEAMCAEFGARYGHDFKPLANAVDLADYPVNNEIKRPPVSEDAPFIIRYVGALADDMTYHTVTRTARVVAKLQDALPVRLEIFTMRWFRGKAERELGHLPGIHVRDCVEGASEYRQLLTSADALLIAYNFDEKSTRYVRLSMANKMPECLASGTPVLAVGPQGVATIDYLEQTGCARVITEENNFLIRQAIELLVSDPGASQELGDKAREFVARHHDRDAVRLSLQDSLQAAAREGARPEGRPLVPTFDRNRKAGFDETRVVARLVAEHAPAGSVMIDVGAHFGTALRPFLNEGWKVLAFEPDESNRAKLLQMLEAHPNGEQATVDIRALSDEPEEDVVFYNSEESTGISGLSAFHDTHRAGHTVDITTLAEVLEDNPQDEIGFLKIDTEGFDLKVLKGFPWDRLRPAIIECEFEDSKTEPLGYTYHDLAQYLVDLGYTVYVSEWHPIIRYGIRHDWRRLNRYPCELEDENAWGNLLAFRDGIDEFDLVRAVHAELDFGHPLGGSKAYADGTLGLPAEPGPSGKDEPQTGDEDEEAGTETGKVRPEDISISLVTPSLNQAQYLDRMLDSVAGQSVQPIEHLIFDAGSKDGSLELFEAYTHAHSWASLQVGRDRNQTHAINLGFTECSGDIIAWLNTDDHYATSEVFAKVREIFASNPDADVVYGRGRFLDPEGTELRDAFVHNDGSKLLTRFTHSVGILQPSLFMRRTVFESVGALNENLDFCMDYEYWIRTAQSGHRFQFIDEVLSEAVLHADSKTGGQRAAQLRETAQMCHDRYGFTSLEWIERLADIELTGSDGILEQSDRSNPEIEARVDELFLQFNDNPGSREAIRGYCRKPDVRPTFLRLLQAGLGADAYILTAFDSKFFHEGLSLVAALQQNSEANLAILVWDLGLTTDERSILSGVNDVWLMAFPDKRDAWFDGYFTPTSYGFKGYIAHTASRLLPQGSTLLWVDAGIAPVRDIGPVLHLVEQDQVFFVNHDDAWDKVHLWNITFATDDCVKGMYAKPGELLAPHLRAGIFGFTSGGVFQELFDEAYRYSLDPRIIRGEKHPEKQRQEPLNPASDPDMKATLEDPEFRDGMNLSRLRCLFGFLGHRHDQTIVSILAARHGAPSQSAREFCSRYKHSSAVSRANWQSSFLRPNADSEFGVDHARLDGKPVFIQHRGLIRNHQGLDFASVTKPRAVVMGNGPSLRGFDLRRLEDFDVFGMNAAYRFWDRIDWYPQYYSCLDTVLGLSHVTEIRRLIEKAESYGIRKFLLRQNLIEALGPLQNQDRVINFDTLKWGSELLSAPTITTGSHTTAWAAYLGYEEVYLMGIDCDYVEIIDGARHGKGTELVMESAPENNPNYFFDDYQQKGDKYNIPNPDRDVHQESWREIAERLQATGANVRNANVLSKVDAFEFCDIEDLVEKNQAETFSRESVFLYNFILSNKLAAGGRSGVLLSVDSRFPAILKLFRDDGFRIYQHGNLLDATGNNSLDIRSMEPVNYLQAGSMEAGAAVLNAWPWAVQKPAIIELRSAPEDSDSGPMAYTLADQLQARGYSVYCNPVRDESWHQRQPEARRLLPYSRSGVRSKQGINLFAFRDGVNEAALLKATGKLELSSVKRLRLEGIQFISRYKTGNVVVDGHRYRLPSPTEKNHIAFAYRCLVVPGARISAQVTFTAERHGRLNLILCRHGNTPYEVGQQKLEVTQGRNCMQIEKTFGQEHSGVRVQLAAIQDDVAISDIRVELLLEKRKAVTRYSNSSESYTTRIQDVDLVDVTEAELTLGAANRFFQQCHYNKAIAIYLHLARTSPLRFYSDNAIRCARKIGLPMEITIEELQARYAIRPHARNLPQKP